MGTRSNRPGEAFLTSTHNLCFEQKYEKYQNFYLKTFSFLVVKFSIYLNMRVFVMRSTRRRRDEEQTITEQTPYMKIQTHEQRTAAEDSPWVYFERKEFAPLGSIYFPFKLDFFLFSEGKHNMYLRKQCGARSDATECGV